MDDAITIYQTDDRNIIYTNYTNIKHASMRSYDCSAGASFIVWINALMVKTCPVRQPSRSRFRKAFSGNCGHLRISCAEWLPDFKIPKAHLIEKRTSQSLRPAMPPICKRNAETHAWHPNVLKDLGECSTIPSAKCSFTSSCGCLSATLSMILVSQSLLARVQNR